MVIDCSRRRVIFKILDHSEFGFFGGNQFLKLAESKISPKGGVLEAMEVGE